MVLSKSNYKIPNGIITRSKARYNYQQEQEKHSTSNSLRNNDSGQPGTQSPKKSPVSKENPVEEGFASIKDGDSSNTNKFTSENVQLKMKELFSNPDNITSYSRYLKRLFDQLEVPSKHAPRRKKFERRRTKVFGPFNTYQMDIVDYRNFEYQSSRYRYVLTIIDCFTKYSYAIPLKFKDATNTSKAVLEFLNGLNTVPKFIYSDA